jgi:ribosomal protein S18 acetylase RimI-like enzyme
VSELQAEVTAALRNKLKSDPDKVVMLVVLPKTDAPDGGPIGIIELYKNGTPDIANRLPLDSEENGFVWLASMAVAKEHQRQGIGSALVAASTRVMQFWSFRRTALHVFADNEAARSLYERVGFEEVSCRQQPWMQWLANREQLLMTRVLPA